MGEGWWQASDEKWYPPETHPDHVAQAPMQPDRRRGTFSVLPDEPVTERPMPSSSAADVPTDELFPSGPPIAGVAGPSESTDDQPLFGAGAPWSPVGSAPGDAAGPDAETPSPPVGGGSTRFAPPEAAPALIYGSPPPRGSRPVDPPRAPTVSGPTPPVGPPTQDDSDDAPRRWWMVAGAAAAVVLVGVGVFALTRGDDSAPSATKAPVSVASETSIKGETNAPTTTDASDPDTKCRTALLSDDVGRPFQECDAYQFRRLQPVVAPNRQDLDTACKEKTYGDACIFIPTTLPPAPFQPTTLSGQGNGTVPLPPVSSGGVVEVHYDGPGPVAISTAKGPIVTHDGPYVGRHYVGDMTAATSLQVAAAGNWTIVVQPLTSVRDATLRAAGDGSDVLRLDNPSEKQVRFTYDGTDQFKVIGHPMVGVDASGSVAVDQAGPVDVTATFHGAIIEIRGTGHWTIIPS
jgi:hypothetical protein